MSGGKFSEVQEGSDKVVLDSFEYISHFTQNDNPSYDNMPYLK